MPFPLRCRRALILFTLISWLSQAFAFPVTTIRVSPQGRGNRKHQRALSARRYLAFVSTQLYSVTDGNDHDDVADDVVAAPSFETIDVDEVVDPEWITDELYHKEQGDNYDNDFDVHAFDAYQTFSCFVNYDDSVGGLAVPFFSSSRSESTWVVYDADGGFVAPAGMIGQLKENLSNYLREPVVELCICAAVLFNGGLVAVSTLDQMPFQSELYIAENFLNAFFAVDFIGRWFSSSKDIGRHVLNPQFALDVLVVIIPLVFGLMPDINKEALLLPAWMTSPSALINLELLRVLRLRRVLKDLETFATYERALGIRTSAIQDWQLQLARVLLSLFTLLSVASGMIYTAEHNVNPAIPDYFTALYFGLVTLTTVGFGDIYPVTIGGKIVVCGAVVVGVAVLPAQAAALVEALLARQESKQSKSRGVSTKRKLNGVRIDDGTNGRMVLETSMQCENCGSTMHWSSAKFCWSCGEEL